MICEQPEQSKALEYGKRNKFLGKYIQYCIVWSNQEAASLRGEMLSPFIPIERKLQKEVVFLLLTFVTLSRSVCKILDLRT